MVEQSQVIIRPATAGDIPALQRLITAHMRYEKAPVTILKAEALHAALFSENPRLHINVAEVSQNVVAYISTTKEYSTWQLEEFIHMDCLFIADTHRNFGIGRKLMQHVANNAKAEGIKQIQWQTPDWNEAAIRFYERQGAQHSNKARFTLPL